MDPIALGAAIAVLVAVVLGTISLGSMATGTAGGMARNRLQTLFGGSVLEQPTVGSALREQRSRELGQAVLGQEWAARTALQLDQADLRLRVGEYMALRFGLALLLFAAVFLMIPSRPTAMMIGLVLGFVGYLAPAQYVKQRKAKRITKLENQLEEALTLISNSLKAGFGLLQSMDLASQQLEHPIATEMKRAIHDINVGSATEEALVALSERAGSYDLDIVVTAILIQRTVGGNLAEILETVAQTMRERGRLRGHIRAVTSQQRMTGYILGALPLGIMAILFLVSRDYITPLVTTVPGQVLLVAAGVLEFMGILVIRRILAIEV